MIYRRGNAPFADRNANLEPSPADGAVPHAQGLWDTPSTVDTTEPGKRSDDDLRLQTRSGEAVEVKNTMYYHTYPSRGNPAPLLYTDPFSGAVQVLCVSCKNGHYLMLRMEDALSPKSKDVGAQFLEYLQTSTLTRCSAAYSVEDPGNGAGGYLGTRMP